jgi:hypothetical protein
MSCYKDYSLSQRRPASLFPPSRCENPPHHGRIAYFFEGLGLITLSGNLRNKSAI